MIREKTKHKGGTFLPIIYLIRGLYPEYIKNSYNSIIKKIINLILRWAMDFNGHFSKENMQMTAKHMKIC